MIGIIGAMQLETDIICDKLTDVKVEEISSTKFVQGKLKGVDVVVATCGCGKVFAALAAECMILRYRPTAIINVGVAGTLSPELHVGDLAIATATVQHDMDLSPLGDPIGKVSKVNITFFPSDDAIVRACVNAADKLGVHYKKGVIATGDQFIASNDKKAEIVHLFDAIACEMEGGAVAHVCYVNAVPVLVLRAMSDDANGDAPTDFYEFATASAKQTLLVLENMLPALR